MNVHYNESASLCLIKNAPQQNNCGFRGFHYIDLSDSCLLDPVAILYK